jgi:RimJ/RimL family protein N-acetyltransferase
MPVPLLNPVWDALGTVQDIHNAGTAEVRFFPGDIAPFIGMESWGRDRHALLMDTIPAGRPFYAMTALPLHLPESAEVKLTLPLYQMSCEQFQPFAVPGVELRRLEEDDVEAMIDLTSRTRPGPFYARTRLLGTYYGIFESGRLVAMAGERLKIPGHSEVSAICTDPSAAGKGYASHLTSLVCAGILAAGDKPFLHVRADNAQAIRVYRRLGFEISADVHFAIFKKK